MPGDGEANPKIDANGGSQSVSATMKMTATDISQKMRRCGANKRPEAAESVSARTRTPVTSATKPAARASGSLVADEAHQ